LKNIEQENLNSHTAYFLVKNCLFVPRLNFLLRTSPFWKFPICIKSIDNAIRNSLQKFLNIKFNENQWTLASLPISNGGLGIRKIQDISMPAFLGSIHGVHDLVFQILPKTDKKVSVHFAEEAIGLWIELNGKTFPTETFLQKGWDIINTTRIIANEINLCDKIGSARFLAAQRKESNAWLHAFPSRNIGTFMDNKILQICVANRFGVEIFEKHTCHCGFIVSNDGRHGLSCAKNKDRFSRHSDLNQIIQRALSSIHISSSLEPCGLLRDDGKRHDGATLIPWSKGQRLIWDVTCVDTLADSYIRKASIIAGSAAEEASKRKHDKYKNLKSANYIFKALAFETLGPWSLECKTFIDFIGAKLMIESGDSKAKFFFYQRISLAIQRGNAASMLGTLPYITPLEEVHCL
jgi:hypothetical protein